MDAATAAELAAIVAFGPGFASMVVGPMVASEPGALRSACTFMISGP